MPRPRHPIREHFTEVPESERKNGAISCNYCGKEQSAGNPKRCQKHLDECADYARVLAAIDAGETPSFPTHSPFETPAHNSQGHVALPYASTANGFGTPQSNHGMTSQSPLAGHDRMTEDQITRSLNLDQTMYLDIERELDAQMLSLNISGAGLLTPGGRNLLKQAFYQINEKWPDIFGRVHEQEKVSAMTSMAYIANRKRRNGQPPNSTLQPPGLHRRAVQYSTPRSAPSSNEASYAPSPPQPVQKEPAGPFGLTTIIAERAEPGGAFVICRPGDLVEQPKPAEEITVNDVKFMPFIHLLQHDDDVMFNAGDDDKIVHTFTGGRTKAVNNEVVWRVALEEMHKNGANPFVFKIYKRHPSVPM